MINGKPNVKVLRRWGRREIACVKMETTSTSGSNLLKNLCEQYDQELASTEVDLDVHEKLIKLMRDNSTINKEQLLSAQKNAKETEKELQLLDDMTNELVQSTSLQGEKIEELKHVQQENMNDITNAQQCLRAAQNTAREDLEKLHSTERDAQKFLESNFVSPNFSSVALKLQNLQETFTSKIQESIDHLASVISIADEAGRLENLEEVVKEMRMDVVNVEGQISEADSQYSVCHEKIGKLNAMQEEEKQRRNAISEKYRQRKRRVAELTRSLNGRKNEKKVLSESINSKQQELDKNKERFDKKSADAAAIRQEVDIIKDKLAKLEDIVKLEQTKHEQEVLEIKERGEAEICAAKSVLMTLREKKSAMLMQVQQARDDLNKKSELEAHKKINEQMELNLKQLNQEKAELQLALDENENRLNEQLSAMKAMKITFQDNKLDASKKREILMAEVKRMSEEIQGLKQKIAEEEQRLKAKKKTVDRQLKIVTVGKNISTLLRSAVENDGKSRQDCAKATQGSIMVDQEGTIQKSQGAEFDMDIKTENSNNKEIVIRETDSREMMPEKKPGNNEEMAPNFDVSETKKLFLTTKKDEGREMIHAPSIEQQGLELSQPTTKYKVSRRHRAKQNLSISDAVATAPGPSKRGRQARKKSEPGKRKTDHDLALTLFDSDMSMSTIKPIHASTPLLQRKDDSSIYNDAIKNTQKTQKSRGKPRGKKAATGILAGNGSSKVPKKKDAYDLDSDFE
uniref:Bm10165, isoform b n=1 Tax=Brugia malayi TaxID=6279 RepID=A0A0J9YAW9_BRUMA|nr:Bm10165, isoform b [Brugia malayi]